MSPSRDGDFDRETLNCSTAQTLKGRARPRFADLGGDSGRSDGGYRVGGQVATAASIGVDAVSRPDFGRLGGLYVLLVVPFIDIDIDIDIDLAQNAMFDVARPP